VRREALVVTPKLLPPGRVPALAPATAIVLAGGRSSRFGADKLAVDLEGRPLLEHAIRAVAAVAREVVVVLSPEGPEPLLHADLAGRVRFARDAVEGMGPMAGVAAGLGAATQPLAIVVGGDQPALVPDLLLAMLRYAAPGGGIVVDAVALEQEGRIRPLPCALRVATAAPAATAALAMGGGSLISFLGRLRLGMVPPERWQALDPEGASLRDIDRPGDLPGGSDLPGGPDLRRDPDLRGGHDPAGGGDPSDPADS
jgi:molybdopterin-guanine dinucleotide biosynthesis protein A